MDLLLDLAPWIALGVLAVSVGAVTWLAWHAWTDYKRVELTSEAATQLLAAHGERLDASVVKAGDQAGVLADGGELLAEELAELRADVTHLRSLLRKIPEAREQLRRNVLDVLLPTEQRKQETDG